MPKIGYVIVISLGFILCPILCFGQNDVKSKDQLTFAEEVVDLGNVKITEEGRECSFRYVNNTKRVMAILNVVSGCGCMKATWSTAPIRPGDKGEVKVSFKNNKGLGYFDKKLSVRTTTFATPVILRLRGNVTE